MENRIYQLSYDFDYALVDLWENIKGDDIDLELNQNININIPSTYINLKYVWNKENAFTLPDIVLILSKLLGGNNLFDKLIKQLDMNLTQHQIKIESETYTLYSGIPLLKDALNIKKSSISYFSDGSIMYVDKPVFLPQEFPLIFQVEEMPLNFFCTELVKKEIEQQGLTGLIFEECKVKSKSWF